MLTHARLAHARQVLSEHDVLMLLNFELSAYEECADCRFTSVEPAKVADETGCNWRGAGVQLGGAASEAARKIAKEVVDEVRETYNVDVE
jgi:hypothetical protein